MRVRVVRNGKTILNNGVLVEGRSYGRIADLVEGFGLKYEWQDTPEGGIIKVTQQEVLGGTVVNDFILTDNFNLAEFECRHCGTVKLCPELVRRLQQIRDIVGSAVEVTSGYRCPTHNKNVGGASNSQHLTGRAADINTHLTPEELYAIADEIFFDGGLGLYSWGIHVDTRGHRARWNHK